MPQIINSNIASLTAQRNLNNSQNSLATSLQRLSSGLRINSAKDDAAGLAISERFTTQIRGLNQAMRNANDGISLAQTGEGALSEVNNNLQRIRELAVQSANATNSDSDRAALDLEVQQRLAEIDRIASQTSFNGRKILDGSFGNATFQVGSEAGQVISLDLTDSTRTQGIGQIASATSTGLGDAATGGSTTISPTLGDYSTAGTVDGSVNIDVSTTAFGKVGQLVTGTIQNTINGATSLAGHNSQGEITVTDFTSNIAQFDVTVNMAGTDYTIGVTLNTDYGSAAGVATAIATQVNAHANISAVTGHVLNDGTLFLDANASGAGQAAIAISNVDTNAAAAGFVASAGTAADAALEPMTMKIDGYNISIAAGTDAATTATNLQTAIDTVAGADVYTVTQAGGNITILTDEGSLDPVEITDVNLSARIAGFENAVGTLEDPGTPANVNGVFRVDAIATDINLNQNYATVADMAADIQTQLDALSEGTYSATVNEAGQLNIANTDGSTVVDINSTDIDAQNAGFSDVTGVVTTNLSFDVDGTKVTLDKNYGTHDAMVTDIQAALDAVESGVYSVTNDTGTISITKTEMGSSAVEITNSSANAIAAGITDGTGTDGTGAGAVTLAAGEFSVKVGDGQSFDFAGSYANSQELATAINRELSGVSAEITSEGKLSLKSEHDITLSGTEAGATGKMGFASLEVKAESGDLSSVNVNNVSSANDAIVRIDSALTEISNLRSSFGAIQNRFESTIASQTNSVENMTASRSRILDADFAAETAALTRAQILQQAGVAMLAQANQLPNNVLSLLR